MYQVASNKSGGAAGCMTPLDTGTVTVSVFHEAVEGGGFVKYVYKWEGPPVLHLSWGLLFSEFGAVELGNPAGTRLKLGPFLLLPIAADEVGLYVQRADA